MRFHLYLGKRKKFAEWQVELIISELYQKMLLPVIEIPIFLQWIKLLIL